MKFYFAPMEGITTFLYRNAHAKYFAGVDQYFTPFLMPNQKRIFRTRELQDVLPEHNQGVHLVPQILTKKPEEFIKTAKELQKMGYDEVNLNVGCPSKTVVSKGKGSGFLSHLEELDEFFTEIFDKLDMKISVKTRVGMYSESEFGEILEIYNKYPISELIIHPRVQKDFYSGKPYINTFSKAVKDSSNEVCYNGDITSVDDFQKLRKKFPQVHAFMIGRGLLYNPALIRQIKGGPALSKEELLKMHNQIYEAYKGYVSGEKNVLFKMKDFWSNPVKLFTNYEKYAKKIKKAQNLKSYEQAVDALVSEQEIREAL